MRSHIPLSVFPNASSEPLHHLSLQLYRQQQQIWPMLAEGIAALDAVLFRDIDCGTYSVRVQFNPKRIVSTAAAVDAASIRERKCFLCVDHLPSAQRCVLVRGTYLVLCNPMPIFREHFTIAHAEHIPQSLEEKILDFLSLIKDLSPAYSLFYNGPKCGASAPDHLHFQASPAGLIPVEREGAVRQKEWKISGGCRISTLEDYGRSVIILEAKQKQEMEFSFLRLTTAMRKVMKSEDEPLMNVIGSYGAEGWRLTVFLRSKHRSSHYFRAGEESVMISPASADIGGFIVTPKEKDFRTIDRTTVGEIYNEVSVPRETLLTILENV